MALVSKTETLRIEFKGTLIIYLRFFHLTTPFGPLTHGLKPFLHMTSYSRRYSTMKSIFLWSAVSMKPLTSGGRCQ
jgi:hypothetical protein